MTELEKLFAEYNAGVDRAVRAYERRENGRTSVEEYAERMRQKTRVSKKSQRYKQRQKLKAQEDAG